MRLAGALAVAATMFACKSQPPPAPVARPELASAPTSPMPPKAGAVQVTPPPVEHVAPTPDPSGLYPSAGMDLGGKLRVDPTDGGSHAPTTGPIFLLGDLSQATTPVYLHLVDVHMDPDTEAAIYLMDPSRGTANGTLDPQAIVGTLTSAPGRSSDAPVVTLEVRDYELDGKRYRPRSILRGMAGLDFAVVPRRGRITIESVALTTAPQAQWLKQAGIDAGPLAAP